MRSRRTRHPTNAVPFRRIRDQDNAERENGRIPESRVPSPESRRMKRRDEVLVGVLLTVAAVVLVMGTLWLARGGLSSGYPLYTRFAWGLNLKQGQPVRL